MDATPALSSSDSNEKTHENHSNPQTISTSDASAVIEEDINKFISAAQALKVQLKRSRAEMEGAPDGYMDSIFDPATTFSSFSVTAGSVNPDTLLESSKPDVKASLPKPDVNEWKEILERLPRCASAENVYESSHFRKQYPVKGGSTGVSCLRKLLQEIGSLNASLPTDPAVWLRFDEELPQYLRALVTAPPGTPYSLGFFCFDIYIPDTYPQHPPKMHLLTTGGGSVRFSPNLYADGKVCLSLLNTWSGPKWNPNHSSLLQLLVSIQGLILGVEHPYYLEPGHGGWEGRVKDGMVVPPHVNQQEDRLRAGTVEFAMLEMIQCKYCYLEPFRDIISAHFFHYRNHILEESKNWASRSNSTTQHRKLGENVSNLHKALSALKAPFHDQTKKNGSLKASDVIHKDDSDQVKPAKKSPKEGIIGSIVARKSHAMEEAASKCDYITAGRLQYELQHLETGNVESMIATTRNKMESVASTGNFIEAGKLQEMVQHLEMNKKTLEDLERRMFEEASRLNFVRAARFQEQYRMLVVLEDSHIKDCPAIPNNSMTGRSAVSFTNNEHPPVSPTFGLAPFLSGAFSLGKPSTHNGEDDLVMEDEAMPYDY